jgi:glycosyltransferase involved in cell wall biosynthesis
MPQKILYVVSEDWYFISHRLPMARAAREAGFEVHVATRVSQHGEAIKAEGFVLHPIPFDRGTLSPFAASRTISVLRGLHREIAPALCHHVALQACVLGSIAAIGRPVAVVNALTGFGYTFIAKNSKGRLLRFLTGNALRILLDRKNSIALVQNPDDRETLLHIGIPAPHIALIPGSGVDTARLRPLPEPSGAIAIGYAGRLLAGKGLHALVAAHKILRQRGRSSQLLIAGTPDPLNPESIAEDTLAQWRREPGLITLGHVQDISSLWARAHIAVLPSRREGLPKSLLEAAACGRPMVATDVPGCREIVISGQTGLLVPVDNSERLADALETLVTSPELRVRYGTAARNRAIESFAAEAIGRQIVSLYEQLLKTSS